METKYWRSINELQNGKPINHEKEEQQHKKDFFRLSAKELNTPSSRRSFLKFMGFSVTAASLTAACERPVQRAIPYLIKPEEVIPGKSLYYASTYMDGSDYCSILVKVRDGRPIKIEGNELSPVTRGGTSARVQASVLSLYDSSRMQHPMKEGKQISWEQLDKEVIAKLQEVDKAGGTINLVTKTVYSPSTQAAIDFFKRNYPSLNHVVYEPISVSALIEANGLSFNSENIPDYKFEEADLVVGFNADFLGTWIFPLNYAQRYIQRRRLTEGQKTMLRHIQIETNLTITGSKADKRVPIRAADEKLVLASVYNKLAAKFGATVASSLPESPVDVDFLVEELSNNQKKSIVLSGSNELECQLLVNAINQLLGNIGSTIDFSSPVKIKKNKDSDFTSFVEELNSGKPQAVILYQVNPTYDYPDSARFEDLMKKVAVSVGIFDHENETAPGVQYIAPVHHFLESWNDAEPKAGSLSIAQPAIRNIFDTRHFQESLLKWAGNNQTYYDFMKANWLTNIYPKSDTEASFDTFWTRAVQDGVVQLKVPAGSISYNGIAVAGILGSIKPSPKEMPELHFYESISIGDGSQANNPWLQELPDALSKVTWENVAAVSPKLAAEKGWVEGTIITINKKVNLPVVVQPGQNYDTISIALGYGHTQMGKVANGTGINAYKLQALSGFRVLFYTPVESYVATGEVVKLAQTQEHDSMEGRPIVRETTLKKYLKDPASGTHEVEFDKNYNSLYPEPEYQGYHWGMSIDLNSCIGCGACVIGCQSENNIPVVGKKQVTLRRAMHWIRIDRYYSENPENPRVFFQPMTCQHCDHAPCENVCPVSATNHSNEGLSQMAYNRCVGTKYCINNCPYKVRRFNWYRFAGNEKFDYNMNSDLGRMVLNPDVTVRERGVVEKCTFCVQRIQEKKLAAKLENKPLKDIDLLTACAQACPTRAIKFGNTLDKESIVSRLDKDPRNYHVLEELHTLPSIGYLTLVRNMMEDELSEADNKHHS